ncbi:carboxypeptidase S [Schizophyllum amplum]|uniref:Carboxypeptidase S n=1 Tax=Schizophyllum amplum TaxID=97359 RepID=A0A550CET8_9AGAR|nr:carboxypeptidase S [Auriculariopsis ampla]
MSCVAEELCPQADVVIPAYHADLWNDMAKTIDTDEFRSRAIEWLSGAVQNPTEVYDDMDIVGVDPRWDEFGPFQDWLREAYPLVHANTILTRVNTWGLSYEWKGSDSSLKPILLMAHQDVVPVPEGSLAEWTYPPFSGHYDGKRIWGRGSHDDKSGLISIMTTLETLMEKGFRPARGIVLSFGFDEEASGLHGAKKLGPALLEKYGKNSFAFLVDEGGGFSEQYGTIVATPGIAEKGHLDVNVEVHSPGGHSRSQCSPAHTSIGILARLLVEYENNPFHFDLARTDPLFGIFQCHAAHGEALPEALRKTVKKAAKSDGALKELQDVLFQERAFQSVITTSQALDMISGGVKSNALPEEASAIFNYRISIQSNVAETKQHDIDIVQNLVQEYNLTFRAFGELLTEEGVPSSGTLILESAFGHDLDPAPVTPYSGSDAYPYKFLSGTIKGVFNARRGLEGNDNIIVAPGMSTGNTDTKYFWDLTPHIFRYNHQNGIDPDMPSGVHTVNEHYEVDSYLEEILFFTTLILNADESRAL